jgi:hypothetical protein
MSPFTRGFAGELLTKAAVSSALVRRVVQRSLSREPDRVGRFIAQLRELGGARAGAARDVAVREARDFVGWGARRGNPNHAVSGTIVDGVKVAAPAERERQ